MNRTHAARALALGLASLAPLPQAGAEPIELTLDPSQSEIDLTMTVDVSVASATDSDHSPLLGSIVIELDDNAQPTQISLLDLNIAIENDLAFNWSFGFLGGAQAALASGSVAYSNPGTPTGPVPIDGGAFAFDEVLLNLGGALDVSYDILIVGSGSQSADLGSQGALASPVSGALTSDGDTVGVNGTIPLDAVVPLLDDTGAQLGTLTVTGSATIVASGSASFCPPDLNGDGELNFFDVSVFLGAYTANDPLADLNDDGMLNFFDVSVFLAAFSAGCP